MSEKQQRKSCSDMFGNALKARRIPLPIQKREKRYTPDEKKQWNAVSLIQKNCIGSGIVGCEGLSKVAEQYLRTSAVQNMKRIAVCRG